MLSGSATITSGLASRDRRLLCGCVSSIMEKIHRMLGPSLRGTHVIISACFSLSNYRTKHGVSNTAQNVLAGTEVPTTRGIFLEKLHENEENWTEKGEVVLHRMDAALVERLSCIYLVDGVDEDDGGSGVDVVESAARHLGDRVHIVREVLILQTIIWPLKLCSGQANVNAKAKLFL